MKKWDKLRASLAQDTQNGARQINSNALAGRWPLVRDVAMQIVVGASVLQNMDAICAQQDQQKAEAQEKKDRKALRKAARGRN